MVGTPCDVPVPKSVSFMGCVILLVFLLSFGCVARVLKKISAIGRSYG